MFPKDPNHFCLFQVLCTFFFLSLLLPNPTHVASFTLFHPSQYVKQQQQASITTTTTLYLEDSIAKMIDQALYRQTHKKEIQAQLEEKNRHVLEPILPTQFDTEEYSPLEQEEQGKFMIQKRKDQRLAMNHPELYCADRCVTTGNCEIFEDMFEMSAQEVMAFCTECVLSEEEEPCDLPKTFLMDNDENTLKP